MMIDYDVILDTQIGPRRGELVLSTEGNACSGTLSILHSAAPVAGTILPDGSCSITGSVHTFFKTLNFTADGRALQDAVDLMLRMGSLNCRLHGKRKEG